METSLAYSTSGKGGRSKGLSILASEKLYDADGLTVSVSGALDTTPGVGAAAALSGRLHVSRVWSPLPRTSPVALSLRASADATPADATLALRWGASVDLTEDGLLSLAARTSVSAPASKLAAAARPPPGHGHAGGGGKAGKGSRLASASSAPQPAAGGRGEAARLAAALRQAATPEACVELTQTVLGVGPGGRQDVALTLGLDLLKGGAPYATLRENAWTLRTDLRGGWSLEYLIM